VQIRVLAFATAAEALGSDRLEVELATGATVGELSLSLQREHPSLVPLWSRLAIAVDGEIVDERAALHDGCEVALLPPVSGGSSAAFERDRSPLERAALVDGPLDIAAATARVTDPSCGAVVTFTGTVRAQHQGLEVSRITYSAYRAMAQQRLARIVSELEDASAGLRLIIVHRLGEVAVGEASVVIAAASPHRQTAYEGSRRALERLKAEVPIWKHEHYKDGASSWREDEPLRR
jgi:molybdopterin synthase catalytic subunit